MPAAKDTPPDPVSTTTTTTTTTTPPPAPVPIDPKNPLTWPRWLKIAASPLILAILIFYFRDQRMGTGIFSKNDAPPVVSPVDTDIGDGVKAHVEDHQVAITYANKTVLPADGLVAAYLTKDDDAKNPQFLAPYRALLPDESFPVVVFLNATNFDTTSEPVCIRRAADGKILFQAGTFTPVRLMLPKKDGTYHLILSDGTQKTLSEKDWVEKFMRLQYLDAPKPEKDKPQFPAPRPPDGKEKP